MKPKTFWPNWSVMFLFSLFVFLFLSAVKSGQFDDLDDPPRRILHDDD